MNQPLAFNKAPTMASASVADSITRLIRDLQRGRDSAAGPLLELYFERLVGLARHRLKSLPGMAAYEEDVALRSFHSLCRRVQDPARPLRLDDRHDLWRLLATRTISRAIDLIRRHKSQEVPGDQDVQILLSREPTPDEAAAMADECRRLLDLLDEPDLRRIALWKVEGWTNEEIAAELQCVPRTVERKLSRIRMLWKDEWQRSQTGLPHVIPTPLRMPGQEREAKGQ
jgi:DNA-directed RNA polymerase specialized sigma24 family protein